MRQPNLRLCACALACQSRTRVGGRVYVIGSIGSLTGHENSDAGSISFGPIHSSPLEERVPHGEEGGQPTMVHGSSGHMTWAERVPSKPARAQQERVCICTRLGLTWTWAAGGGVATPGAAHRASEYRTSKAPGRRGRACGRVGIRACGRAGVRF